MKKIQIFGTGCAKCKQLEQNVKSAVQRAGVQCEIEKVADIKTMMTHGVMMTPALALDGIVKAAGKVLSVEEIVKLLQ